MAIVTALITGIKVEGFVSIVLIWIVIVVELPIIDGTINFITLVLL